MEVPSGSAPRHPRHQDLGIHAGRGLAAYGVVVLHSSFGHGSQVTPAATLYTGLWFFVVPFFLTAAFYYTWLSLEGKPPTVVVAKRWERLWLPYAIWTVIYASVRASIYGVRGDLGSLHELCRDPIGLAVLGHGGVQLYFIPLLAFGLLPFLIGRPLRGFPWPACAGLFAVSLALHVALVSRGDAFGPAASGFNASAPILSRADHPISRLLLSVICCMLLGLPYFFGTLLLVRIRLTTRFGREFSAPWFASLPLVLLVSMLSLTFLPAAGILSGLAVFSICLVTAIPSCLSPFCHFLGVFSAGCYFAHHLVVEGLQIVIQRFAPAAVEHTGFPAIIGISLGATIVTYTILPILTRCGRFGRSAAGLAT